MQLKIDIEFKNLIPPLTNEERKQLEVNIIAEGCRDSLTVWDGVLLDGHNRYEICTRLNIDYKTQELELPDKDAARIWIINNQLGRRNLTPEQASYLRGKRYNSEKVPHGGERSSGNSYHLKTAEKLAQEYKVSEKTIRNDGDFAEALDSIADNAGQDVKQKVLNRDSALSKSDIVALAQLPKEELQEVIGLDRQQIKALSKEVKAKDEQGRRSEKIQKIAEISKQTIQPLYSIGRFPLIYADPPWQYEFSKDDADEIENHYPTLTIGEICKLSVEEATTNDCILFLWTTSPKLEESFQVINSWGFKYRTCAIWDKAWIGPGYYFRQRHELLLIAVKGNLPTPEPTKRPASIFEERRTTHSKKPEIAYQLIEQMYPELPKLELFARQAREGWVAWGNQVAQEVA